MGEVEKLVEVKSYAKIKELKCAICNDINADSINSLFSISFTINVNNI